MKSTHLLALVSLLLPVAIIAQPAPNEPRLVTSLTSGAGYSSEEGLSHAGLSAGKVSVTHFDATISGRHAFSAGRTLLYGLTYKTYELDHTGALLPDRLAELSLNLGWQQTLSANWSLTALARPGIYSDFEDFSSRGLNLPLLILANYAPSRDLVWNFGLNANPFSDHPVLPILGVRWKFAPQWTFNLGFPRSGFAWQTSEKISLRAGVGFQGGSFRLTQNHGVPTPGTARLANTFVDYREVQVGFGADVKLTPRLALSLDAGAITDRKFDYFDRDYRLDGDNGFYTSVSLKAAF